MVPGGPTLPFPVSYMGSKKWLAPQIDEFLSSHRSCGPFLDLFAGMGAIPAAASRHGQVLAADIDIFPALVNYCHLAGRTPLPWSALNGALAPHYEDFLARNTPTYKRLLDKEAAAFPTRSVYKICEFQNGLRKLRHAAAGEQLYFTNNYAGTYFGLRQTLQIDALRTAIEECWGPYRNMPDRAKWALLALAAAAASCSTSTGHFAQHLNPTERNVERFSRSRRASIADLFARSYSSLKPCGDARWRKKNIVWHEEATQVIASTRCRRAQPAFVFCDPPYTKDQYSRYYGFYESLVRNDRAPVEGKGRCRTLCRRTSSAFCRTKDVEHAFRRMIDGISSIGAGAIIAYRHDAMLPRSYDAIAQMLRTRYKRLEVLYDDHNSRSTMGGAHGTPVTMGRDFVLAAW